MENYFNYFTEIEEHFRRCRGTLTLLTSLDWALVESWKEAGIPLEAVLAGIERSFEKFARRPKPFRKINGLAYCSQLVLEAAEELSAAPKQGGPPQQAERASSAPFASSEILEYLTRNAEALDRASQDADNNRQQVLADDLAEAAATLRGSRAPNSGHTELDLQELERRLSVLEEKITASLTRAAHSELLTQFRREVEQGLAPYRRKMSAAQIDSLERQFLKKRLFESYSIPRLSLFYL